jgi:hypothetical protein
MRKSSSVPLTLLAVAGLGTLGIIAASEMDGCDNGPAHCVDAQNHLMPDAYCQNSSFVGYHYVYGGSCGGHLGDVVFGGSISRGGFGQGGGDEGGE